MTETVSQLADIAFLLSDNPAMIVTMPPQAVLHALLPDTANRNRIMPAGSTYADVWMLKKKNPLSSVDAALTLMREIEPKFYFHADVYEDGRARVGLYLGGGEPEISVADGVSETLPGAIVLALLAYVIDRDKGKIA